MRSRYSAYVMGDGNYLMRSWDPSTRPPRIEMDADLRWIRLEVLDVVAGGLLDREGTIEFVAHYEHGSKPGALHERSRFVRVEKRWVYVGVCD